ncbi:MAG TPA: ABC transporter ATP-binding protein [Candidatus Limnocylindrales bacterium]|nr:ABC transporter ATP-binding protein [Candidatus Limnocylindrales bacterium]
MSAILAAEAVTVAFGGRTIVSEASLSLRAGERVALVGPNGAGKSTLLRVLTGVLEPRDGSVSLDGQPIRTLDRKRIARSIAVVPELAQLPFAMTVREVVGLGRLPHDPPLSGPRQVDEDAVDAAIERVGVSHLADRDARRLSMGERQLVFVAIALAQAAPILVLDEPTAHLDIRHQVDVMQLLVDLNERDGATIVAVLHDLALAANFFPRVALMRAGRIVADGPPADTLDAGHIRGVFGVDPALVRLPLGVG